MHAAKEKLHLICVTLIPLILSPICAPSGDLKTAPQSGAFGAQPVGPS